MFAIAYIILAGVLFAVEMRAVKDKVPGNTITEYTRSMPFTMAAMGGLIFWAAYHFVVGEFVGYTDGGNLAALIAGVLAGLASWWWRRR